MVEVAADVAACLGVHDIALRVEQVSVNAERVVLSGEEAIRVDRLGKAIFFVLAVCLARFGRLHGRLAQVLLDHGTILLVLVTVQHNDGLDVVDECRVECGASQEVLLLGSLVQ